MDPAQIHTLVQRLIADPEDGEALQLAYQAGTQNPEAYASLLEQVGQGSPDAELSAHWYSEAANVWESLGNHGQRNRLLGLAATKDPSNAPVVEKVAQLYREAGDVNSLAQLLERMTQALPAALEEQPEYLPQLIGAHEELAKLYSDGALANPDAAAQHWAALSDLDPQNAYAIYSARELFKSRQRWAEALPLFAKEIAIVTDPERKLSLLRDEAEVRRSQGDLAGMTGTLRQAHQIKPDDPGLTYELAYSIVERIEAGQAVSQGEHGEAAQQLVGLAELYDGEHAMMYAQAALKAEAANDRAMQLADHHARALGRQSELAPQYTAYLIAAPAGYCAQSAREALTALGQPVPGASQAPPPSSMAAQQQAPQSQHYPQAPHSQAPQHSQPAYSSAPPQHSQPAPSQQPQAQQPQAQQPQAQQPQAQQPQAQQPQAQQPQAAQSQPAPSHEPAASQQPVASQHPSQPAPQPAQAQQAPPQQAPPQQPAQPAQPQVDPNSLEGLLMQGADLAKNNRKPQAYQAYRRALEIEPANSTALTWVEDFLRQRRKFADLRDVLIGAAQAPSTTAETKVQQLREVAQMCEQKLRDFETAINCWKEICQIDRADVQAREHLVGLLEKQKRWDELAPLLEQEAMNEDDVDKKIEIEQRLATLHVKRRNDPIGAAEAWSRIAQLRRGDVEPMLTAVGFFEKGQQLEAAANVLTDGIAEVTEKAAKAQVLQKIGEIRNTLGDPGAAGDAFSEAGELTDSDEDFERAATAYQTAQRWADAAHVVERRAQLAPEGPARAALLAQAGQIMLSAQNPAAALSHFEAASELDPDNDELATRVEEQYHQAGRHDEQVAFLLRRAEKLSDTAMRVGVRHRAAAIQRSLGNEEGAKQSLELVLSDGDDVSALQLLLDMVERAQDWETAAGYLQRLVANTEGDDKLAYAVREAHTRADGMGDLDAAIATYENILETIDPQNRYSLHAMSDLEMRRNNHAGAAVALEKLLTLPTPPEAADETIEIARQLAQLYEGPLDDIDNAIRVLDIVHQGDEQDFDAIARLQRLAEKKEDWPRVADLLAKLIEVEGDDEEASEMTRQLASVFQNRMGEGQQALAVLERLADGGDAACQHAYADLGIELGWKGIVARKLVQWNESVAGSSRAEALKRAFALFVDVERAEDARTVALELARSKDCHGEMAHKLEEIATGLKDLDALAVAHDIIGRELSGAERASEFVRQAEVMAAAGADALDAIHHGELALAGVGPDDSTELMARLAALTEAPGHVIDLYERQVQRCKKPQERVAALAAAAQVAAARGAIDRAREFFNSALSGGVHEDTLTQLEEAARNADQAAGGDGKLLRTMAEALADGGQGSRDGGRTRSALLRRAALIAQRELGDVEAAFNWLGDSLIAHVDDQALAVLDDLGKEVGDDKRVEQALTRALDEVYDGPLVRKLLRKRADLRKLSLADKQGAAGDLKRLHDLSPSDQDLTKELSKILTELGDHRGMIELYEDQILRGREPHVRAELARKVARIWEEQIGDAREAADAWRRVLRMKAGDKEAQAGLERAKSGKLKKPPPVRHKSESPGDPDVPLPPGVQPFEAAEGTYDAYSASDEGVGEAPVDSSAEPAPVDELAPAADAALADEHAEPAPIEPAPIEPAPIEPAPIEPAPIEPAPIEPAPVEPAPVEEPAPVVTPDDTIKDQVVPEADPYAQPQYAQDYAGQPEAHEQPVQEQPPQEHYDPNQYDPNQAQQQHYDPNQYDPNQPQQPQQYDPNQYDPNQPQQHYYDPNQPQQQYYDTNQPQQQQYDPNQYDPNAAQQQQQYDPNQYDPNQYDPNQAQQQYYHPNQHDPNQHDPNQHDPNQAQQQYYDPNQQYPPPVEGEAIDLDASDAAVELIEDDNSPQ